MKIRLIGVGHEGLELRRGLCEVLSREEHRGLLGAVRGLPADNQALL